MTSIRRAVAADIPRILELYEELTDEKQELSPQTISGVFDGISQIPDHHFLVAENDGMVVGTLFALIVPNLSHKARPWAVLENVVVDGRCRRAGVGRLLIQEALKICGQAGCYKVQLLSNKQRHVAHKFYRSLGFEDSALGFRIYLESTG